MIIAYDGQMCLGKITEVYNSQYYVYIFLNVRQLQCQVKLHCVWWSFVTGKMESFFEFLREDDSKREGYIIICGELIAKNILHFVVVIYV